MKSTVDEDSKSKDLDKLFKDMYDRQPDEEKYEGDKEFAGYGIKDPKESIFT